MAVLSLSVALLARNAPLLGDTFSQSTIHAINLDGAATIALRQASTLAGFVIAIFASASLGSLSDNSRLQQQLDQLEPSAAKRTMLATVAVMVTIAVFALVTFAAIVITDYAQTLHHGQAATLAWNGYPPIIGQSFVVLMLFALVAQVATRASTENAVVGGLAALAAVWMSFVAEVLTGPKLGAWLPTGAVARTLQLPGAERGSTFVWTSGLDPTVRVTALLALAGYVFFALGLSAALSHRDAQRS